jgi:hypothetical protein
MVTKSFNFIRAASLGFFLNAVIWLALGLWSLSRLASQPRASMTMLVIAILMIGNVAAFIFCGMTIGRKSKWFAVIAFFVLGVNILLTLTDQVGIIDWTTWLIDLIILGLLIAGRKQITRQTK